MALDESIPGGAYLGEDRVTWFDAEGRPLDKAGQKAAQDQADKNAQDLANAEAARVTAEMKSRNVVYVQAQPAPVADDSAPSAPSKAKSKA
jgi:hypothetical protein